jgi:ActR/RegA family two-component response regulator
MIRALIVEDETLTRRTLRRDLQEGDQVIARTAHSATVAKKLLDEMPFDCGMIDLSLQKKYSGISIIKLFRDHYPDAYIEAITGHHAQADAAIGAGADVVIHKPLTYENDLNRVARGVVAKRIRKISDVYGLHQYSFDVPKSVKNELWASLAIAVDTIQSNLAVIKHAIEDYDLFKQVAHNLLRDTLCRYDATCLDASVKEDPIRILEEIKNKNLQTFQREFEAMRTEHEGEYVAVVEGKIISYHNDFQQLVREVRTQFPNADIFIDKL